LDGPQPSVGEGGREVRDLVLEVRDERVRRDSPVEYWVSIVVSLMVASMKLIDKKINY
jgi:hypothetical protein